MIGQLCCMLNKDMNNFRFLSGFLKKKRKITLSFSLSPMKWLALGFSLLRFFELMLGVIKRDGKLFSRVGGTFEHGVDHDAFDD